MLCAGTSTHGALHHQATSGPGNTQRLLTFLSDLRDVVLDVVNPVFVGQVQFSPRCPCQKVTLHV